MKTPFLILILLILSLFVTQSRAQITEQKPRYYFPTVDDELVFKKPGKYPELFTWYREKLVGWSYQPTSKNYSAGCDPKTYEQALSKEKKSGKYLDSIHQSFWSKCTTEYEKGLVPHSDSLSHLLKIQYDYLKSPFFNRIAFRFADGTVLKGVVGLKDRKDKRPLVMIRLGIFSNSEDFIAERALVIQLFEQGPFNVLILDNLSSAEYATRNPHLSIGGPIEGLQNIEIAKILRDAASPLAKLIDSIHVIGISLGGNGMLKSVLLNEFEQLTTGHKPIQGFVGLCPVIDVYNTFAPHMQKSIKNIGTDILASLRMDGFRQKQNISFLDLTFSWLKLEPLIFKTALKQAEIDYPKHLAQAQTVAYPFEKSFQESAHFIDRLENIQTPVNIFYSEDDPYTPKEQNAELLSNLNLTKNLKNNFGFFKLNSGIHCTFQASNDWNAIAAMINGTILSQTDH